MITRQSFPADVERALRLVAELTPASQERDAMLRTIARETERFSKDVRPRPSICRVVEIAWIHLGMLERGIDPEELWADALREALPFLLAEQPSPRWASRGDALVFYDPEPTRTYQVGDITLRWASWDDNVPEGKESAVALWTPYLDMITSSSNTELRRAWCELCVLPAWQLSALVDPQTFERFSGAASPELIRERILANREIAGDRWVGAREAPYVLGRLASWLGAPPDQETVCIAISDVEDRMCLSANDRGEGFHSFTCYGVPAGFGDQLTRALFADGPLSDVEMLGYNDTDGTSFRTGCRGGLPFLEIVGRDAVAPWYRNPR